MRLTRAAVVLLAFSPMTACVSGGAAPEGPGAATNVLTRIEIDRSYQTNAHDLIQTLRPAWLRLRGQNSVLGQNPVMVYVDGNRLGGPEWLRGISTLSIAEIRFYRGVEAHARFGLDNTNGAIAIRTRRG